MLLAFADAIALVIPLFSLYQRREICTIPIKGGIQNTSKTWSGTASAPNRVPGDDNHPIRSAWPP